MHNQIIDFSIVDIFIKCFQVFFSVKIPNATITQHHHSTTTPLSNTIQQNHHSTTQPLNNTTTQQHHYSTPPFNNNKTQQHHHSTAPPLNTTTQQQKHSTTPPLNNTTQHNATQAVGGAAGPQGEASGSRRGLHQCLRRVQPPLPHEHCKPTPSYAYPVIRPLRHTFIYVIRPLLHTSTPSYVHFGHSCLLLEYL